MLSGDRTSLGGGKILCRITRNGGVSDSGTHNLLFSPQSYAKVMKSFGCLLRAMAQSVQLDESNNHNWSIMARPHPRRSAGFFS